MKAYDKNVHQIAKILRRIGDEAGTQRDWQMADIAERALRLAAIGVHVRVNVEPMNVPMNVSVEESAR